jgi:hypothetical protein
MCFALSMQTAPQQPQVERLHVPLLYQEVQSVSRSYRHIVLGQVNAKTLADSTVQYRFCIVHVESSRVNMFKE